MRSYCARNAVSREGAAEGRELVRRPRRQRELRAIMRAAIAEELRALYRVQQDEPLPERLTELVRQLAERWGKPGRHHIEA
jgi:hypothetical protein